MPTLTEKNFGVVSPANGGMEELVYTVPASTKAIVKSIRVCNYGGYPTGIYIFFVPPGQSFDAANAVYCGYYLSGYATLADDGYHVLEAGSKIYVMEDSGTCVTFHFSGAEIA